MPATNKVATQLLLRPEDKTRVQALAVIRQDSQAEVARMLVVGALPQMEASYASQLAELEIVFRGMGVEYAAGVDAMLRLKLRWADLFNADGSGKKRFPGGLAAVTGKAS